jgi:Zn-dependent peptidase ImmA (M78 family)
VASLNLSTIVLDWAARSVGESLESIASTLARRPAVRERIMRGELTVAQAEKLAKQTRVPFGLLFLEQPPQLTQPSIPDLRQMETPAPLSRDFFDVLADVLGKQEWYATQLKRLDASAIPFVGKFKLGEGLSAAAVANDIRATLGFTDECRSSNTTPEAYFSAISLMAESAGVLVMKNGIVKSNTRRALAEQEFRGFALADPLAPIVFVNGRDAGVASVFTLLHELAHIWLGETGVSDVFGPNDRVLERFCNRVAADFLVPKEAFLREWQRTPDADVVARHFRVSRFVVGIRAVQLGQLTQAALNSLMNSKLPQRKRSDGGNGLANIPIRNSRRLTHSLVMSAVRGDTMYRDAARLLNVRPDTVVTLAHGYQNPKEKPKSK